MLSDPSHQKWSFRRCTSYPKLWGLVIRVLSSSQDVFKLFYFWCSGSDLASISSQRVKIRLSFNKQRHHTITTNIWTTNIKAMKFFDIEMQLAWNHWWNAQFMLFYGSIHQSPTHLSPRLHYHQEVLIESSELMIIWKQSLNAEDTILGWKIWTGVLSAWQVLGIFIPKELNSWMRKSCHHQVEIYETTWCTSEVYYAEVQMHEPERVFPYKSRFTGTIMHCDSYRSRSMSKTSVHQLPRVQHPFV